MALAERRYRRNRIVRFNRQPVQTVSAVPRLHPKGTSSRFALRAPRWPLASSQWQGRRLSAFFILHFSVFRIPSFPCPAPTANSPARRKKSSDLSIGASCWRYLSSRAVTRKVLSAQMSLTSVFGMGTGVPSPQSTPTIYLSSGLCPRTFIIIPPLDSLVKRFFGDPSGIRTHVNGVRGRCLNHLTMGPWCTFTDSNRGPTD